MEETPDPVNILLPQSLTPSPHREATPIIPAPWNKSPTPEEIPLPPIRKTAPSSLDLIPLPWDIPPSPKFPAIVLMTPSHTQPLLPRHPDSRMLSRDKPTPPEWEEFQPSLVMGKRKELSLEEEPSLPKASSSKPILFRINPLFEKHEEFVREEGPSWKEAQPSPSTGK